jgi:hypothetical protein
MGTLIPHMKIDGKHILSSFGINVVADGKSEWMMMAEIRCLERVIKTALTRNIPANECGRDGQGG